MAKAFIRPEHVSSFRRIAAGMWHKPSDPSIYGSMDLDVTDTLRFIEAHRAEYGDKLTITHLVAHAVARVFARHPEWNAKVRFGGRIEQRTTVDLFVSVSTDGGRDLSGVRLDAAERLSLREIAREVSRSARDVRGGTDPKYQRSRDLFRSMPWWLVRPVLRLSDVLTNELHFDLPEQGLPRDPFGTAVITNVGSFGIDLAFAPFLPLGRCAMLLLMSEVRPRPYVVDGRLEVRPVLRLCGTFDHRIVDGYAAGVIARELRQAIEHPEREVPPPRRADDAASA